MSIQRENIEFIKRMLDEAIKLDPLLIATYKKVDIGIKEDEFGCSVMVSELAVCQCNIDGSVWLKIKQDDNFPIGDIPVLLPLDRESFLAAMFYLGDINVLREIRRRTKKSMNQGMSNSFKGLIS